MSKTPVYINIRDRFTTTKRLARQVAAIENAVPVLIDNSSTYEPLVEWLAKCDYEVIRVGSNGGHHSPWRYISSGSSFSKKWGQEFYIVTDCDLDIGDVPSDVLSVLAEPFSWGEKVIKSGLSLRIDDLPEWQTKVMEVEAAYWQEPIRDGRFFVAPIDTTFCMYSSLTPHSLCKMIPKVRSIRSSRPYSARHMPWYLDCTNLDEENKHYYEHANSSASWRPDGKALNTRFQ